MTNEQIYFDALKQIAKYQTPEQLKRIAEKQFGCSGSEALEMAYENVLQCAQRAIRGKRRPKDEVTISGLAQGCGKDTSPDDLGRRSNDDESELAGRDDHHSRGNGFMGES